MLSNISVNINVLEQMLFFWQSVMDREKVGEYYLTGVAALEEMSLLYDEEFNAESVRKVLSAITNREILNTTVKKERQFWNSNMMVTEDRELLNAMISPIKTLNLDNLKDKLNEQADIPFDKIEILFLPGLTEPYFIKGNQLFINFFKVFVNLFDGTGAVTIESQPLPDYITAKILSMPGVTQK